MNGRGRGGRCRLHGGCRDVGCRRRCGRCCYCRRYTTSASSHAAEDLAEHVEHVQLTGVLGLATPLLLLQPLLLHLVEVVLCVGALLQESLKKLVQGQARQALPAPTRGPTGGGCGRSRSGLGVDGFDWNTFRMSKIFELIKESQITNHKSHSFFCFLCSV